ncbi:unnamed protein product (macronuclear) [Paramecium tetraurelia]|uniref:Calcineurin-like phosphoesterase domain-containing protein n=1 Tax=Paramecium tetraurelia TaxID=5888 RepID=A0BZR0_PARTE|nr:uncharacterized protein GSPATT00005879001 [Paramecium tetraurelia]CAK64027.1 unnamed protein product [Paramecium tetraurelia]|eukprot:XP_001431425.1 hypothetical protein (macronuclear) [Paramecium tetraurelia strain d4-2]
MFEWMPILKGKYFTAEQYLQIIVLVNLLIFGLIFYKQKFKSLQPITINLAILSFSWFGDFKYLSLVVLIVYNRRSLSRITIVVILYLLTYDVCFAMHNINQGFIFSVDGAAFSTQFTRLFQENRKFHPYVTLTQYHNAIIFNFQIQDQSNYAVYCNSVQQRITHSKLYDRYVYHSVIQIDKKSNQIQIYDGQKMIGEYYYFDFNSTNITIIDGGDSGYTETSIQIWKHIQAEPKIDVINIGGDVAYDNGFVQCTTCWDRFLSLYESVCKSKGKLIPLILSIGNHDVGRVTNPSLLYDNQINSNVPNIIQMFPQQLISKQIPQISDRTSYFVHRIGHINFITIDSGYMTNSESQKEFLKNSIEKNKVNLVSYHVPVVPLQVEDENFLWNLGEDLNRAALVFEHHKHNFKRTKKIQVLKSDNKIKVFPGNTYYVGNGAMGIQSANKVEHQIVEKSSRQAHFWVYNYDNGQQYVYAVNKDGSRIDYFELDQFKAA